MIQAQNRHMAQRNIIKDLETNPFSYHYTIFDKVAKNIFWRKGSHFSKWCCENWISIRKRVKLDSYTSLCTKSIQNRTKTLI
jgi:hypothetical protein